jgi:hypothetical protein
MMREGRTEEEYQIFLLESRFFSDQFAKSKIICANDYLFSAICASQILNHPEIDCDGIWYPSVAYKYRGFNSVYKPSLIDAGVIQLRHVFFIRLLFYDDRYPQVRYLRDTLRFDKNRIIW